MKKNDFSRILVVLILITPMIVIEMTFMSSSNEITSSTKLFHSFSEKEVNSGFNKKIQQSMIREIDLNPDIPGNEYIINTGVVTIGITRYGFRLVKWYDNTSNTELAANSGVSSAGGDLITNRYPLWSWVTNQPWTGELWDAPFDLVTQEVGGIATIQGFYVFNSTYEGTASDLAGLNVTITFQIAENKHWGNLTINFTNPTASSIGLEGQDTGNPMGYTLGWGSKIGPDHSSDYQAYSHGGQSTIGQTLSWNFFQWNDLEWSGIYDLSEGAFGGMIYHNTTKYFRLESSSWGIETRVCYSEKILSPGESVTYSLSLYGGPLTSEMEEAGITGFLEKLGIIGSLSLDRFVYTTDQDINATIFLENVAKNQKEVTVNLHLDRILIYQWTNLPFPGSSNLTLVHIFNHSKDMGSYNLDVEVLEGSNIVFEKTINLNIVDTTLTTKKLYVSFVWHQHQPFYTEPFTDPPNFLAPWAQAHTEGPYLWHVEDLYRHPNISVTINLQPSLLVQWLASRNGWNNSGTWTYDWVENINKTIELHYDILHNQSRNGKLEILTSGYNHPIFALLANWGWWDDINRQMSLGKDVTSNLFDYNPHGAWQPEMSFNTPIIPYWIKNGINHTIWSDVNLGGGNRPYEPYWVVDSITGEKMVVFFRHTTISNYIGFTYNNYPSAEDAARDLMGQFISIYKEQVVESDSDRVLTIAADGENWMIWGAPSARYLLEYVYTALEESQILGWIQTATLEEAIQSIPPTKILTSSELSYTKNYPPPYGGGSWVDGTTSTWYGEPDENLLWNYIMEGRDFLVNHQEELTDTENETLWRYITIAEGSDAFWWLGSDQQIGDDWQFCRRMIQYIDAITTSFNYPMVTINEPRYSWQQFVEGNSQDKSLLNLVNIDLVNDRTIDFGSFSNLETKEVTFAVESRGGITADSVVVELILPEDLELYQGSPLQELGDMAPLTAKQVTWVIRGKENATSMEYYCTIQILINGKLHHERKLKLTIEIPRFLTGSLLYQSNLQPGTSTTIRIYLTNVANVPATSVNLSIVLLPGLVSETTYVTVGNINSHSSVLVTFSVDVTGFISTKNLTFILVAAELKEPTQFMKPFTTAPPSIVPTIHYIDLSRINVEEEINLPIKLENHELFSIYGLLNITGSKIFPWYSYILLNPGNNSINVLFKGIAGGKTTIRFLFSFNDDVLIIKTINTIISDSTPPNLAINAPSEIFRDQLITITVNISDHSAVTSVILHVSLDDGTTFTQKFMTKINLNYYAAIIGPFNIPKVTIFVSATDEFGNKAQTSVIKIRVKDILTTTTLSSTFTTTTTAKSTWEVWPSVVLLFSLTIIYHWRKQNRK
ncbi:MAG: hypothetical protein ACFFB5_10520 [Promethearchaeota archaeon]